MREIGNEMTMKDLIAVKVLCYWGSYSHMKRPRINLVYRSGIQELKHSMITKGSN